MRSDDRANLAQRLIRRSGCRQWSGHRHAGWRIVLLGIAASLTMAATTTETIAPLAAVGRLDYAGFEDEYHCTATLIAPHVAITAAHCMETPATIANTYFQPGFEIDRGRERLGLSAWHTQTGGSDIALLCLTPAARTPPMPRAKAGPKPGEGLTIVGYGIPAERGQRHDSCTVDAVSDDGSFVLNCPLRPGQSGAPVLRHTEHGREIVGVASATSNRQSLAWTIPGTGSLPACPN